MLGEEGEGGVGGRMNINNIEIRRRRRRRSERKLHLGGGGPLDISREVEGASLILEHHHNRLASILVFGISISGQISRDGGYGLHLYGVTGERDGSPGVGPLSGQGKHAILFLAGKAA